MRRRTRAAVLVGLTVSLAAGCIDREAEFDEQVETIWLEKFEQREATAWLEAGHEFVGIDGASLLEFLTEIKSETGTESFVLLDEGGWGWVVVLRLPEGTEDLQQLHALRDRFAATLTQPVEEQWGRRWAVLAFNEPPPETDEPERGNDATANAALGTE